MLHAEKYAAFFLCVLKFLLKISLEECFVYLCNC